MLNEITEKKLTAKGENYIHKLDDHDWTWKKLIVSIFAYAGSFVFVCVVLIVVLGLIAAVFGGGAAYWNAVTGGDFESLPFGDRFFDLILFALFPAGILANRLVFKSKPGELLSVEDRVRWKWLLRCAVVLLPVMVVGMTAQEMALKPFSIELTAKALTAIGMTLILTPLQCMGEEMLFRGWPIQILGPIFRNKKIAWLILGVGMSVAFSVMHEPVNVFVTMSLALFGILACAMIYITGRMEAGIIMHTINNAVLFSINALAVGGRDFTASSAVGSYATKDAIVMMIGNVVYFCVVVWLWKRYQRTENK